MRIGGHDAWSTASKHHLGYSPDLNSFYEEMTGREFVYTMARLHGFSRVEARRRTEFVLEEVGMADRARRRLAGCSHGMRQRIKLAQSLVHDPWLLLLDEPLSGIDPGGRREINELLFRLADQGKTILVSSHILVEIEQLSNSILMMSRGRIVASGTLAEVRGQHAASADDDRDRGRAVATVGGAVDREPERRERGDSRELAGGADAQSAGVLWPDWRAGLSSTESSCSVCKRSTRGPTRCSTTCSRGDHEPAARLDDAHVAHVSSPALVGQHRHGAVAVGRLPDVHPARGFDIGPTARTSFAISATS